MTVQSMVSDTEKTEQLKHLTSDSADKILRKMKLNTQFFFFHSFSTMILSDAAVLSKILVLIVLVGEVQMNSMDREQDKHMVRGIKMPHNLVSGNRDFMDYQVIQKYSTFVF